jgi:hypothetical protein
MKINDEGKVIMTVNEVLNYNRIIKAIVDEAKDVNSLIKFRLLGMCKQFEPIVANFEIIREEKIKKYGTEDKEGNIGIFTPIEADFEDKEDFKKAKKEFEDAVTKYTNDLNEVLQSEAGVEIERFKQDKIMDAGLPSDYLIAIYDLIEE